MGTDEARGDWTSLVLLERFRGGDDAAAAALFARHFDRLTALARGRTSARLARRADPEEVALSAYRSFFAHAREGRYALGRGGDLWRLLASIARHKVLKRARREGAARRSFAAEVPLDVAAAGRIVGRPADLGPEDALALADDLAWAAARLDEFGRRVLELRLRGMSVAEVAADSGRSERTVRRALAQIREVLADRFDVGPHAPGPAEALSDAAPLSPDDFLLLRMIGAGRMGKVYRARRLGDGVEVAVKYLRRPLLRHPGVVRRFLDEARTVAAFDHPNIVATRGLGRTPGGSHFLVMDLVDGPDLARHADGRAVAEREAVGWMIEVCDALAHAHGRGVVHCDLKPANILLDRSGSIRVADFGLARPLAGGGWRLGVEGTAPFMAPEQACRSWGPIDRRTDIYGVGAVLYALLTGQAPHVGGRLAEILAAVAAPVPVPHPRRLRPDLHGPLGDLCARCLSKDPRGRPGTAEEVRSELAAIREGPARSRWT